MSADGAVQLSAALASGSAYDVRVLRQPASPNQRCAVANGHGTVGGSAVTLNVSCATLVVRFASTLDFNDESISHYAVDSQSGQLRFRSYGHVGRNPVDFARDSSEVLTYVLSRGDATLSVFVRNAAGDLQRGAGSPFQTGGNRSPGNTPQGPTTVTAHPSLPFVYVANGLGTNTIAGWSANLTHGGLTPIPGSPFAAGAGPRKLTIDTLGRFAYVTNQESDDIYVYSIDQTTGALSEIANARVATGDAPGQLMLHPNGRLAFVPSVQGDTVAAYTINPDTGLLTPAPGSPFAGSGPIANGAMLLHPSRRYLYVRSHLTNNGPPGGVSAYSINMATGALTHIGSAATDLNPMSMAMSQDGRFVYVANRGDASLTGANSVGSLIVLAVDAQTGALTAQPSSITHLQPAPYSVALEPGGEFAYVTSAEGNLIRSYNVDTVTGALSPIDRSAVQVSRAAPVAIVPYALVGSPAPVMFRSRVAYVPNQLDDTISAFQLDQTQGTLTSIAGSPFAAPASGPRVLALDPSNSLLLGASRGGHLTVAAVDPQSRTPGEATSTGTRSAYHVVGDASGRFAFVSNGGANDEAPTSFTGYAINPIGRAATAIAGYPVSSASSIHALTMSPVSRIIYAVTDGGIELRHIDPETGAVTRTSIAPITNARGIAFHPDGRFAYVSRADTAAPLAVYSVHPHEGLLASVDDVGPQEIMNVIAIEPTGRFLYAAGGASGLARHYAINQNDGSLTSVGDVQLPAAATAAQVDYSGRYLYVLCGETNAVHKYAIDPATGTLSQTGEQALTGTQPSGITLSRDVH